MMKKEKWIVLELLKLGFEELLLSGYGFDGQAAPDGNIMQDGIIQDEQQHDAGKIKHLIKEIGKKPSLDGIIITGNKDEVREEDSTTVQDAVESAIIEEITKNTDATQEEDSTTTQDGIDSTIIEEIAEKNKETSDAIEDYRRHTELYRQFMSEQYQPVMQRPDSYYKYAPQGDNGRDAFAWGDDVISYHERKSLVKKMMVNAVMHGEHNPVDPRKKEAYKFWKYASKFNFMMSTLMYDKAFNMT